MFQFVYVRIVEISLLSVLFQRFEYKRHHSCRAIWIEKTNHSVHQYCRQCPNCSVIIMVPIGRIDFKQISYNGKLFLVCRMERLFSSCERSLNRRQFIYSIHFANKIFCSWLSNRILRHICNFVCNMCIKILINDKWTLTVLKYLPDILL